LITKKWLKAKTRRTTARRAELRKRRPLTPLAKSSGSNSEPPHHFNQIHLAIPVATDHRDRVYHMIDVEKVEDNIKGRVVTANQADLDKNQESFIWRKIKLIIDDTRGYDALTSFYGADMTRDQLCSLIKKRKTLIEAIQDCKSADGYVIRVFVIAFTRESYTQKKKTNYALTSQQKAIRKKINEIINKYVTKSNATELLNLFTCETI
jgi:ribosomal protein S3AE